MPRRGPAPEPRECSEPAGRPAPGRLSGYGNVARSAARRLTIGCCPQRPTLDISGAQPRIEWYYQILQNDTHDDDPAMIPVLFSGRVAGHTRQLVAIGDSEVYAKSCASCHGANLQGLSAPALTGPGFGHSNLNAAQLRGITTQQMPLTAPGSLPPADYAAVMAFMLNYDCVPPTSPAQPFPTTAIPALQHVTLGGTTCPPETSAPIGH